MVFHLRPKNIILLSQRIAYSSTRENQIEMSILKSFIVFEGLDGAGTTTQARNLARYYEFNSRAYFATAEPTSNPIGKLVREVLQKKVTTTPEALAYLYAADRSDHLYNPTYGIARILQEGRIVISDRYFYSSLAYQGVECDIDLVRTINAFPHPEALIFIDTPVEDCLERIERRGEEKELFDRENFLRAVRNNYLEELKRLPDEVNVLVVDGRKSIEETESEIRRFLSSISL